MTDFFQEADRIEPADECVGRVVLHPEERGLNLADDFQEDVLGLRELRIAPRPVLVVILHAEDDVPLFGIFE